MLIRVSVVQDTFDIPGRGLIVVLDWPHSPDWHFQLGKVVLRRPDGSEVAAEIVGWDMFRVPDTRRGVFLRDIAKSDVPIGTEVWMEESVAERRDSDRA